MGREERDFMTLSIRKEGPCPCGSGKPYGECCYEKQQQIVEVLREFNKITPEDEKLFEEQYFRCMEMKQTEFEHGEGPISFLENTWNLDSVAKMETQEILEKLESMHIQFDKEQFKEQAQSYISTEKLADDLYYTQDYEPQDEEDFIWLAINELWKRFLPEKVNIEMIDDDIFYGYDDAEDGEYEKALEKWKSAWKMIPEIFSSDTTSTDEIMEICNFSYPFSQWLVDYANLYYDMGLNSTSIVENRMTFIESVLERFPDIDDHARRELLVAKAESLAYLGKREEAESLIHSVLEEYPKTASAYAVWGTMYWQYNDNPDYEKAEEIYNLGMSRCEERTNFISEQIEEMNTHRHEKNQ